MLELVFIIMVIGILAVLIAPKSNDKVALHDAAKQVLKDIRYTQHLALVDDMLDTNDAQWYKERWQIAFFKDVAGSGSCGSYSGIWSYTIYSDRNHDAKPQADEMARNPLHRDKVLSGGVGSLCVDNKNNTGTYATTSMALEKKYGINDIAFSGGCSGSTLLSFDHVGRVFKSVSQARAYDSDALLATDCNITLCMGSCSAAASDEKLTITITPETGYARIVKN